MGGGLTLSHQSHLITMQSRSRTFNDAITVVCSAGCWQSQFSDRQI